MGIERDRLLEARDRLEQEPPPLDLERATSQQQLVGLEVLRAAPRAAAVRIRRASFRVAAWRWRLRSRPGPRTRRSSRGRIAPTRAGSRRAALTSWAVMRSRGPARRTVPSSTVVTSSFSPTTRRSSRRPLNAKQDVRAATRKPFDLRERVEDLVGDAVGEVLVVAVRSGSRTAAPRSNSRDAVALRAAARLPRPARAARRECREGATSASLRRQRRRISRTRGGVPAGSAAQSGSRSRMRAIRSDAVSPRESRAGR